MVLSAKHDLTTAQTLIYSKKNIARAYEGFDDTDITGIYKIENDRKKAIDESYNMCMLFASLRLRNFYKNASSLFDLSK